jgi:hypothetical protein
MKLAGLENGKRNDFMAKCQKKIRRICGLLDGGIAFKG